MATTIEAELDSASTDGMNEAFGELIEAMEEDTDAEEAAEGDELPADEGTAPAPDDAPAEPAPDAEEEPPAPETTEQAFTYTVDGQPKTYDGIKLYADKDGNPVRGEIPADKIKDVQYRLQRGDYLETQNGHLYSQVRQFEAVGGMQKVQDMAVEVARLKEAATIMADTLEDPEKLIQLAYAIQNGDRRGLDLLGRELKVAAQDAALRTQSEFRTTVQQQIQTQDEPTLIANTIGRSITQWASRYPNLTREDTDSAFAHLRSVGAAVVWKASPEEARQAGVRPGEHIIDHRKVDAYLNQLSAYKGQQAKTAQAVTAAAKENVARTSAAKVPPKKAFPKKPTTADASGDEGETWSQQRARMMAGQFSSKD